MYLLSFLQCAKYTVVCDQIANKSFVPFNASILGEYREKPSLRSASHARRQDGLTGGHKQILGGEHKKFNTSNPRLWTKKNLHLKKCANLHELRGETTKKKVFITKSAKKQFLLTNSRVITSILGARASPASRDRRGKGFRRNHKFSDQKQVISKKKRSSPKSEGFFWPKSQILTFFPPQNTQLLPPQKIPWEGQEKNRGGGGKNENRLRRACLGISGLELHFSGTEPVTFFGAQPSLGGHNSCFGAHAVIWGHGPGMPLWRRAYCKFIAIYRTVTIAFPLRDTAQNRFY